MNMTRADDVRTILRAINQAWQEGRAADAGRYLHDDVVMVMPDFAGRIRGRAAMVASWQDFLAQATLEAFAESEYQVDIVGAAALASYAFQIRYVMDGRRYQGRGRDVWGFSLQDGQWTAVWRLMTDMHEEEMP